MTTSATGPVQLFTVIALVSLPTVMFGGYSLLGLLRKGKLTETQRGFFRAGHAHAGVLLVLALLTLQLLGHGGLGTTARWITCFLLLFGVLGQSGGLFLHLLPRRGLAHGVTAGGGLLLAVAMLMTAYGVAVG
ncbi:hypothetical protein FNH05_20660 [Amycolatopsis rhizosphaerae]|uniref:Uncharacterized protein n=1 Tax=Amycolatopsis rhizosphaerae TaxID=2053003 RepID=A0A558C9B1_9PSEU|nr:hypothetical protein [Amycolatopsis rhizosphaerae]TVT45267.1 hypothetical protein FNH05_20660 [Amycolatopsis rhizosphaerae]